MIAALAAQRQSGLIWYHSRSDFHTVERSQEGLHCARHINFLAYLITLHILYMLKLSGLIAPRAFATPLVAFALAFLSSGAAYAQQVLRVSAIPDEAPTELQRKFKPLGNYLEQKLGMKVEFTPVTDYAASVEGLVNNKLDMVWFGGFTFVQAKERSGNKVIPLVQREEDEQFKSVFITTDKSINKLKDLKGKTFSFGSESSTSGHLMPRSFLLAAKVNPDTDMKRIAFSGAHDATVARCSSRISLPSGSFVFNARKASVIFLRRAGFMSARTVQL